MARNFLRSLSTRTTSDAGADIPLQASDERWKKLFRKYDTDNNGHINLKELEVFINSREYDNDIPEHVVRKIHERVDQDGNGELDYEEFVNMITHPDYRPLFGHLLKSYINVLLPPQQSETRDSAGQYEDQYTCCPPPVGMVIISLIEIIFYIVDTSYGSTASSTGPVATALIYDPQRRYEVWRYVTYMFVHIGVIHLIVNLAVQLLLGTPLEMVHGWWRVLFIYFAGVIAGSLGTSITDPAVKLAGASGGVYSLITAHIATLIMNWGDMEFPVVQLLIFLLLTGCDVGTSIYNRYILEKNDHIGYAAHFAGGLAGLLVGIYILRNLDIKKFEKVLWWLALLIYVILMLTAIIWNIALPDYFPKQRWT